MSLFLILALIGADPVSDAYARVSADLAVLAKAQQDVAALSKATAQAKAAQEALVASKAALLAAIDAAASDKPVVPPVVKVVRIVAIVSDSCPDCTKLSPVLKKLQTEGIPIEISNDPIDAVKYKISTFPTLIMVVDDIGVSRSNGSQPEAAIRDWFNATVKWSLKK